MGEGLEVLVCERLVEDRPQVLGGLKLGGGRGEVGEAEPIWHDQGRLGVAAGDGRPCSGRGCHPALSAPSTIMRARPAPASRANNARSAAKTGLDTPFDTY